MDCPKLFKFMTDRSLALDGADHPYIAYGEDHLYYAYHDGSAWHHETADVSLGVGKFASLALDGSGYAHISYYDRINQDLKYAQSGSSPCQRADVNDDGNVNMWDVQAVAARWRDPALYDPQCDVAPASPDGVINIRDIMTVVADWGPCP